MRANAFPLNDRNEWHALRASISVKCRKMKPLSFAILCACCGCVSSTDIVRPVYAGTIEACRQLQERAIDQTETRETAIEQVNEVRRRCDIAYAGIEIAAEILEESSGR